MPQASLSGVCDYCDCRELAPIKELSDEHERIATLAAELRRRVESGQATGATLASLQAALGPHLAKEEAGLFAELARRPGFEQYLAELLGDHEQARATLLAFPPAAPAPAPAVLGALDDLARHIETEEYDLFPASRMILDDAGWHDVQVAHRRADAHAAAGSSGGWGAGRRADATGTAGS